MKAPFAVFTILNYFKEKETPYAQFITESMGPFYILFSMMKFML